MRKMSLQCISEAIAHSAPALGRPMGRVLQTPLPGLFVPQVVLTRQTPASAFRTIVFDLRPIGADLRTEDVRISCTVSGVLQGEGVLAHFARGRRLEAETLSFAANRQHVPAEFVIQPEVESVTVMPLHSTQPDRPVTHVRPCNAFGCVTAPEDGSCTHEVPIAFSGTSRRWGSGSSRDHRVYRPLRPPTPPVPPDSAPDVTSLDQAILDGLTFTVFDVWHHKRTLPRREGQHTLDSVELALSLTPEVRRPWNHRFQVVEWGDFVSPQFVIWGPDDPQRRVIPIANPAIQMTFARCPCHMMHVLFRSSVRLRGSVLISMRSGYV